MSQVNATRTILEEKPNIIYRKQALYNFPIPDSRY
jgi:hypothetical protein